MKKETNSTKLIIIISIIVAVVIIAGVVIFVLTRQSDDNNNTNETSIVKFVDARGNWYEFTPDENVKKSPYNKSDFKANNGRMTYVGDDSTYRLGIDVSDHKGDIDWNKVKADGIDFVFIRIGGRGYGASGKLYADKKFDENYNGAKAVGLDVGCYFFSQAISEEEAVEEANYVLGLLNGRELDLPICYDPESILDDEARTDNVSGEQFTKNCIAFFDTIDKANKEYGYSYKTMLYANMVWEAFMIDLTKLSNQSIWYADYEIEPQTPYDFSVWQYSETGNVNGIAGVVDLDIMLK